MPAGSTDRDRRVFAAAALTAQRTGVAVLTHCEGGKGGVEQVEVLAGHGVDPGRVVLSHTDKVGDLGYHRALLDTGANVVYDQGIRTPDGTERLVLAAAEAGRVDQVLLGTDGARRSLWRILGGSPGLAALRTDLGARLAAAARPRRQPGVGGEPGPDPRPYAGGCPVTGRLAGRSCLVTGATGMAADAARRFAAEGAAVVVLDRDEANCVDLGLPYVVADLADEAGHRGGLRQRTRAAAAARRDVRGRRGQRSPVR